MQLFGTPISSPLLIALTAVYGICAAITAFDTCIAQAKRAGYLANNKAYVPVWAGLFAILLWAAWITIFVCNWWYALALFGIVYCLNQLSVLKHVGARLLWLMVGLPEEIAGAVDTAVWAADDIKAMNRERENIIKAMNRE